MEDITLDHRSNTVQNEKLEKYGILIIMIIIVCVVINIIIRVFFLVQLQRIGV